LKKELGQLKKKLKEEEKEKVEARSKGRRRKICFAITPRPCWVILLQFL
jgi:hypothetical protein